MKKKITNGKKSKRHEWPKVCEEDDRKKIESRTKGKAPTTKEAERRIPSMMVFITGVHLVLEHFFLQSGESLFASSAALWFTSAAGCRGT